jgi:hypothetical protein
MRRLGLLLILAAPAQAQDRTPDPPWMQERAPADRAPAPAPQAAPAQEAARPFLLRLAVSPEGPVWVGQRIGITVTAMTPVRFATPPAWPDITASEGRLIVLPEASTVPGTERVNGQTYAVLQHNVSAFAGAAGTLVIAPVAMSVRVGGPDGQLMAAQATAAESRITARLPPGVGDVTRLVVAPAFRMTAAAEGGPQLRVGEAVVRTLRMEADDTSSMLLPPGAWGEPEGVRLYPDPPVLQDRSDRGTFHALRSERVAFVPQRPGRVELPGFSVTWFEPRSGRAREVKVDPVVLDVLPAAASGTPAMAPARWIPAAGIAGAAALGVALLSWWWRRRRPAEPAPIGALAKACQAGDAKGALRALYRWCDAVLQPGGERTVAALARRAAVPELTAQAALLEAHALSLDAGGWNGRALLDAARRTERRLHHATPGTRRGALPALNPIDRLRRAPRLAQPRWMR